MRRGILGGTFDPPHLAHLVAAETAYRQLGLDVVTFMPTGDPWQKPGAAVSSARHRLHMTRLTVEGVDYFEVDDRETRREGPTYTVETLEELAGDDLVLILGADAAAGLNTWMRWSEISPLASVAVAPRPGTAPAEVNALIEAPIWLDMPHIGVAGTDIRARRRAGHSARFLVREKVWRYLREQDLYS